MCIILLRSLWLNTILKILLQGLKYWVCAKSLHFFLLLPMLLLSAASLVVHIHSREIIIGFWMPRNCRATFAFHGKRTLWSALLTARNRWWENSGEHSRCLVFVIVWSGIIVQHFHWTLFQYVTGYFSYNTSLKWFCTRHNNFLLTVTEIQGYFPIRPHPKALPHLHNFFGATTMQKDNRVFSSKRKVALLFHILNTQKNFGVFIYIKEIQRVL